MSVIENIIQEARSKGHSLTVFSSIKSGKEADVFQAELDGTVVALKIYKDPKHRTFRNAKAYVAGKYYKKPSERKAVMKGNAFSRKLLHTNWIEREFFLLQKFHARGVAVPEPLLLLHDAFCMEYLGDTFTAPRLCDATLSREEYTTAFETIMKAICLFWDEGIVHGDLSPFNILWHNDTPYIIDFPQAVDIRNHPQAEILLERDIHAIWNYFHRKMEHVPEHTNLITKILGTSSGK